LLDGVFRGDSSISLYVAFVKIKEKDINKAQIIVLAIIIPIILFISFLAMEKVILNNQIKPLNLRKSYQMFLLKLRK